MKMTKKEMILNEIKEQYKMNLVGLPVKDIEEIANQIYIAKQSNLKLEHKEHLMNEHHEIAAFWLDKYRNSNGTSEDLTALRCNYVRNNLISKEYEAMLDIPQDTSSSKLITFGCVYLDGSEGTVQAFSIEEALEQVPSGTQVF